MAVDGEHQVVSKQPKGRGQILSAVLVPHAQIESAIEAANVLRRLGVSVFVFSDRVLMQRWLNQVNSVPGLFATQLHKFDPEFCDLQRELNQTMLQAQGPSD
jgi:hypothetical protein